MRHVRFTAGLVFLLAGLASVSVASVSIATAQGGAGTRDPLTLFEPMYPVFSSDRCVNCHGGVNVVNGEGHPGGPIAGVKFDKDGDMCCDNQVGIVCASCHDEGADVDPDTKRVTATPWKLAPKHLSLVDKDLKAMCVAVRDNNGLNAGDKAAWNAFMGHLESDTLVGFAFEGKRGITESSPEGPVSAEPPPMTRDEFLQAADRWLRQGDARCGPWKGTISQTISRNRVGGGNEDVLDAQVDISVEDGDARAHVTVTGHQYTRGQACEYRRDTFRVTADTTADLNVMLNADLASSLSLPNGITIPNVPNIPGVSPGGLPSVPVPDSGGSNAYSLLVKVGQVKGTDDWEQSRAAGIPPTCTISRGTTDWPYQPTFGVYQRALDPNDADHLKDSDASASGGDEIRVAWDLTR